MDFTHFIAIHSIMNNQTISVCYKTYVIGFHKPYRRNLDEMIAII